MARPRARAVGEEDPGRGAGQDSLGMYLKEISKVPLLSAKEEVILARCIQTGQEAAERLERCDSEEALVTDRARVTADERLRREGIAARRILVESNLRLVVSVARRYRNR